MRHGSLSHLADSTLSNGLGAAFAQEDTATANLLAYIDEFDERKLYVPAGYPSMLDYCVGKLGRSRDAARKRIHAAHTARRFPIIFELVAGGRLHLSAVVMLAPHLTAENAEELLEAAANKSKDEIRLLLSSHLPRSETLELASAASTEESCAPERTEAPSSEPPCAPGRMEMPMKPTKTTGPVHLDDEMEGLVSRAQALLGYELRSDDPKEVIRRSLRLLVRQLEKRQSAVRPGAHGSTQPRPSRPSESANPRHIPPDVKSAVWERDRGMCTFVSERRHRCASRKHLEFDHIEPVARGGQSTVGNLRLRCRAHNQFEAERVFGRDLMQNKRHEARQARGKARVGGSAGTKLTAAAEEVIPYLRQLRFRADEARRAAALCETIPDASIEERVKLALSYFRVRGTRKYEAPSHDVGGRSLGRRTSEALDAPPAPC